MSAMTRAPAVAGSFYPGDPGRLRTLVAALLAKVRTGEEGTGQATGMPVGLLVPHAGLEYSGAVAAAAWACIAGDEPLTVVILGTNHSAGWLVGVGAWTEGDWETPLGPVAVDEGVAAEIAGLGMPFSADSMAHLAEHSIEVQLPLLAAVAPAARIVPLAVSCGTGSLATETGERLGRYLAGRIAAGEPVFLAISTDMAHYPRADAARAVTAELLPAIEALDAPALAAGERAVREGRVDGLACGMCGIEPAVLGLAALRAMGATRGTALAAATSADEGGPEGRTVGYLAVRFDA
jgi:AmmeMemoRadiSam system protein B